MKVKVPVTLDVEPCEQDAEISVEEQRAATAVAVRNALRYAESEGFTRDREGDLSLTFVDAVPTDSGERTTPYGISPSREAFIPLPSGNFLAFPTTDENPEGCDYIRIVGKSGCELGYWSYEEWEEDPTEVMRAIMGACQGNGYKGNEADGGRFYRFAPDREFPEDIDVDEEEH